MATPPVEGVVSMALNMISVKSSLAAAHKVGLRVDLNHLESQLDGFDASVKRSAEDLAEVGLDNPTSWKQVQGWLASRGHTSIPNTRTETLQRMGVTAKDEAAAILTEYRSAVAQARAIADVMGRAEPDGPRGRRRVIRCQWTEANTGRIYTARPNLQGSPAPVREAIHAREGRGVLFLIDWHCAELFGLAVLAEEWPLVAHISEGGDAHQYTADILDLDRKTGKIVNLGLAYGMTVKGMVAATGLHLERCTEYLEGWFDAHPKIRSYREWLVRRARREHAVQVTPELSIPIPEEKWTKNPEDAERSAVAYAGQGIIASKLREVLAVPKLRKYLRLPMHDGALYELPSDPKEQAEAMTRIIHAWELRINGQPLQCSDGTGITWAEARGDKDA